MKKLIFILMLTLCIIGCGTLAPRTAQELITSYKYHKTVESDYSYQESIQIIKDDMSDSRIDCIVFPDMKMGECRQHIYQTGVPRVGLYMVVKEKDDNHSTVDLYAFWERWLERGVRATGKLKKNKINFL